jgi:hypothetical protein
VQQLVEREHVGARACVDHVDRQVGAPTEEHLPQDLGHGRDARASANEPMGPPTRVGVGGGGKRSRLGTTMGPRQCQGSRGQKAATRAPGRTAGTWACARTSAYPSFFSDEPGVMSTLGPSMGPASCTTHTRAREHAQTHSQLQKRLSSGCNRPHNSSSVFDAIELTRGGCSHLQHRAGLQCGQEVRHDTRSGVALRGGVREGGGTHHAGPWERKSRRAASPRGSGNASRHTRAVTLWVGSQHGDEKWAAGGEGAACAAQPHEP